MRAAQAQRAFNATMCWQVGFLSPSFHSMAKKCRDPHIPESSLFSRIGYLSIYFQENEIILNQCSEPNNFQIALQMQGFTKPLTNLNPANTSAYILLFHSLSTSGMTSEYFFWFFLIHACRSKVYPLFA